MSISSACIQSSGEKRTAAYSVSSRFASVVFPAPGKPQMMARRLFVDDSFMGKPSGRIGKWTRTRSTHPFEKKSVRHPGRLVPHGFTFAARVAGAQALFGVGINADGFVLADKAAIRRNLVAAFFETGDNRIGNERFEAYRVGQPLLMKTRSVDRGLRFHVQADPVDHRE